MTAPFAQGLGRLTAVAAIALWAAATPAKAARGPFSALGGQWTGGGHISLSNGTRERIRCRASYAVGADGRAMQQALRCASDSYNFELRSDVQSVGNRISGVWSEQTRGIGGTLQGYARHGRFEVDVKSETFNAQLTLVSRGNHQTVDIKPKSKQFTGAFIRLTRRHR